MFGWKPVLVAACCAVMGECAQASLVIHSEATPSEHASTSEMDASVTWRASGWLPSGASSLANSDSNQTIDVVLNGVLMNLTPADPMSDEDVAQGEDIQPPPSADTDEPSPAAWSEFTPISGGGMVAVPLPPALQAGGITLLGVICAGVLNYARRQRAER